VLAAAGLGAADVDLVVPHQANLRIIEAVANAAGIPMEKVMLTVHKYANMSSATVPVSLVEALNRGRIAPRATVLLPGFGGGLTYAALLVRWGERVAPLGCSPASLPPCPQTALEIVNGIRASRDAHGRSLRGLMAPIFPEARTRA
jgi:3-oxoacyl-[acyl-carrier-protein] synthase-3